MASACLCMDGGPQPPNDPEAAASGSFASQGAWMPKHRRPAVAASCCLHPNGALAVRSDASACAYLFAGRFA